METEQDKDRSQVRDTSYQPSRTTGHLWKIVIVIIICSVFVYICICISVNKKKQSLPPEMQAVNIVVQDSGESKALWSVELWTLTASRVLDSAGSLHITLWNIDKKRAIDYFFKVSALGFRHWRRGVIIKVGIDLCPLHTQGDFSANLVRMRLLASR